MDKQTLMEHIKNNDIAFYTQMYAGQSELTPVYYSEIKDALMDGLTMQTIMHELYRPCSDWQCTC